MKLLLFVLCIAYSDCIFDIQGGTEAPDRPVLFVEATPDPTPGPPPPHTGPSTSGRHSHSPRPASKTPTPAAVANPAVSTSSDALNPTPPPFEQGSDTDKPPPGMPLRDWIKQKKRSAAAAGASTAFPNVQVYCPCGSAALVSERPHAPVTGPRVESQAKQECSSPSAVASDVPGTSQQQLPASQHQSGTDDSTHVSSSCLPDR